MINKEFYTNVQKKTVKRMVRLATDTSANLPRELLEKHNIAMLAFQYTVDGKEAEYKEDWDSDGKRFFEAMREIGRASCRERV